MTSTLPQPTRNAYQLSDNLRETGGILNVRPAQPDEAEREELVLAKLGTPGWGRLHHFRNYYSAGWGEGAGKPLSPRALEKFYRFIEQANFPAGTQPSLFLTDNGTLELCWEDEFGKSVQLEFTPNGIAFFQESSQLEGLISQDEAVKIAK